ncbi:hypothetical protein FRC12_017783, partial [Ceratobasidium sp. 428]
MDSSANYDQSSPLSQSPNIFTFCQRLNDPPEEVPPTEAGHSPSPQTPESSRPHPPLPLHLPPPEAERLEQSWAGSSQITVLHQTSIAHSYERLVSTRPASEPQSRT